MARLRPKARRSRALHPPTTSTRRRNDRPGGGMGDAPSVDDMAMDLADQGFLAHCCLCRRQPSYNEKRTFHPRAGLADISRNAKMAEGQRSAGTDRRKSNGFACRLPVRNQVLLRILCHCRPCAENHDLRRRPGLTAQHCWCGENYVGDDRALIPQNGRLVKTCVRGMGRECFVQGFHVPRGSRARKTATWPKASYPTGQPCNPRAYRCRR